MRLKTFTAPSTAEAMALVREELGDDAIIVSTQRAEKDRGARVVAAIEDAGEDRTETPETAAEAEAARDIGGTLKQMLHHHGTPEPLIARLVRSAVALNADDPTIAAAGALDGTFRFKPLTVEDAAKPVMLVGPPGVGKTVTTAKLAARRVMRKGTVGVVTTDSVRAGAVEQLEAFTRILQTDLAVAATVSELLGALDGLASRSAVYVDTAGANPFSDADMDHLSEMIDAVDAEPVLVLAAGGDAVEAAEIAAAFTDIGARRLIVTRIDLTRRLGSVLAAADAGHLAFADVSITPDVADGLSPINPVSLARLLMPDAVETASTTRSTEARI